MPSPARRSLGRVSHAVRVAGQAIELLKTGVILFPRPEAAALLKPYPRAHVIGPAYWIYELQDFSDPVHLNIPGAERYSKQLAALFQGQLASRH